MMLKASVAANRETKQEALMQSKTANVDGIVMRWEEHGEGAPLILLHGIPTCPALWRHVMPRLEDARCLA